MSWFARLRYSNRHCGGRDPFTGQLLIQPPRGEWQDTDVRRHPRYDLTEYEGVEFTDAEMKKARRVYNSWARYAGEPCTPAELAAFRQLKRAEPSRRKTFRKVEA